LRRERLCAIVRDGLGAAGPRGKSVSSVHNPTDRSSTERRNCAMADKPKKKKKEKKPEPKKD
jgi:hypothetical protein